MKKLFLLLVAFTSLLNASEQAFFIPASDVVELLDNKGITIDELMKSLVSEIKPFARPDISNYYVGVVGLGKSGNLYLGVNLELQDLPSCIHGEQFMLINARNHGEEALTAIALSAAPCGFCRQFINEIGSSTEQIAIYTPHAAPTPFSALLPHAFGPQDLGLTGGMLSKVQLPESDDPIVRTLEAVGASYAPYSNCPSGVSLLTKDGKLYSGSYIENAAYNPSVSPMLSALVGLVSDHVPYDEIATVYLAEAPAGKVKQLLGTLNIMTKVAPAAQFVYIPLE